MWVFCSVRVHAHIVAAVATMVVAVVLSPEPLYAQMCADANGDGLTDVDMTYHWYENDSASYANGVQLADLDGDGDLDRMTSYSSGSTPLAVTLGDGTGAFATSGWSWSASRSVEEFALVDFDGDGDVDIAAAAGTLEIFANDGTGTFTNSWTSAETVGTDALVAGDVDNDGDVDIVVSSQGQPVRVYKNGGAGTFSLAWTSTEIESTDGLALGDVDKNGLVDIAVANDVAGDPVRIYFNDAATPGTFPTSWTAADTLATSSVAVADFNGDTNLDLLVSTRDTTYPMVLYAGDGAGGFTNAWNTLVTFTTDTMRVADMNGDGTLDAVLANSGSHANRIYLGDGAGNLLPDWSSTIDNTQGVAVADIDGNGMNDLVFANERALDQVWLNTTCTNTCGDGVREAPAEGCDDGNTTAGDGCDASCAVEAGYDCGTGSPSTCSPICGDGLRVGAEGCDDANRQPGDGCDTNCAVESHYTCDGASPTTCTPNWTCGDGVVTAGSGTACTFDENCVQPERCLPNGTGWVCGVETCDDGGVMSGDGCSADCALEVCGDGVLNNGEGCDDRNTTDGDGCSSTCTVESGYTCTVRDDAPYHITICRSSCGDGVVASDEECDGQVDCNPYCMWEACGNWVVESGEGCDDGNLTDGDGCSATCTVEAGWKCDPDGSGGCIPITSCDGTAVTILVESDSWRYDRHYPFWPTFDGNGDGVADDGSWIFVYQNIPAFTINAGDIFALDGEGTASATDLIATIEMAPVTNGDSSGNPTGPWVTVVSNGTANGRGNTTEGDYDIEFTTTGSYSHGGGGLLMKITASQGDTRITTSGEWQNSGSEETWWDADGAWGGQACTTDADCGGMSGSCEDTDLDGIVDTCRTGWDSNQGEYTPNFLVYKSGTTVSCIKNIERRYPWVEGGLCDGATSECSGLDGDCFGVDRHCGYDTATCSNCADSDGWDYYTYSSCNGSMSCTRHRLYYREYYCYNPTWLHADSYCTYTYVYNDYWWTDCQSCNDGDSCTSDFCSGGTCYNNEIYYSCYDGPSGAAGVGACAQGTESCRNPGVCTGSVYPRKEVCDGIDNDCDGVADEAAEADASCDDGDANTDDVCESGTCQNYLLCTGTDTDCGYGSCESCDAKDGWYPIAASYDCCDAFGQSCTCTQEEKRDYFCSNTGTSSEACDFTVVDGPRIAYSACVSCDDGDACTDDSCNLSTGLCDNVCNTYSEACYTGPAGTEGVGTCEAGTWTCDTGTCAFGACSDVTPTTETCDGYDQDCDGSVDNNDADTECAAIDPSSACFWGTCDDTCTAHSECVSPERCFKVPAEPDPGRCADPSDPCADVTCPAGQACYKGACYDHCTTDLECDDYPGNVCHFSERCLPPGQQCKDVQCELGEICHNGGCYQPCATTSECTDPSHVCYDATYCAPATDPCQGIDCALDEMCYQGSCYTVCGTNADCSDPSDVCYDATRCAPESDPCFDVMCAEGEICYEGTCYQDCSTTACTDPGDSCYDATRCATDNCEGVQCPENFACHGGVCYETCTTSTECTDATSACYDPYCKVSECDMVQCAPSEVCYQGVCYDTCMTDMDCTDPTHACYNGYCTDDPCADVLCLYNEVCYQGTCYEDCSAGDPCTDPTHVCYDGRCAADPCADVVCATSETCYQGTCYETCVNNDDCTDPSHVCYDQYCRPEDDPCWGVNCYDGQVCYQGTCYEQCTDDTHCSDPNHACYAHGCGLTACDGVQCASDETCYNGVCYEVCDDSIDCSDPTHQCYDNRCVDPCDGVSCLATETCYNGTCYDYCDGSTPCNDPDHICFDNRCVSPDDPYCDGVSCPMGESCYRGVCYPYCDDQADCDPESVCYDDTCIPKSCDESVFPDHEGYGCEDTEVCYNGVCYEECGVGDPCTDPNDVCYDNRCANSQCEAMDVDGMAAYDANHIFHSLDAKLVAQQRSMPYIWPRPVLGGTDTFTQFAAVGAGAGASSGAPVFAPSSARVVFFLDQNTNEYYIWLTHGSTDAAQAAAEATYDIQVRGANPPVALTDDQTGEAHFQASYSGLWAQTQAHVTTGASETGGIAIGPLSATAVDWEVRVRANFAGDITRWEIYDGETPGTMGSVNPSETLTLRNAAFADTDFIAREFGYTCDVEGQQGICSNGTYLRCRNFVLDCQAIVMPFLYEVCDGLDNTCDGLVDANSPDLRFPMLYRRQDTTLDWRPLPTYDSAGPVNDILNYGPSGGDDRVGSTDVQGPDGTSIQAYDKAIVFGHRNTATGDISLPMLHGARTSSAATEGFGDQTAFAEIRAADSIEEVGVCWYDDRKPANNVGDAVLKEFNRDTSFMSYELKVEADSGQHESDAVVARGYWREAGGSVPPTQFSIEYPDFRAPWALNPKKDYTWQSWAPRLGSETLDGSRPLYVQIRAAAASETLCVADAPVDGCWLGNYFCSNSGAIACGTADPENCKALCVDADGDGEYVQDPFSCPSGTDCDDQNPAINSGSEEICDGYDNNCDGAVDMTVNGCDNGADMCGPKECQYATSCVCDGAGAENCYCGDALSP